MGDPALLHKVSIRPVADGAAVRIGLHEAQLNFDAAEQLRGLLKHEVAARLDEGHRSFVLSLEDVGSIDSCGVGTLVALHHQITAAGGVLALIGASAFVVKVLRMMGLDRFLRVYPTEERALKALVET